LPAESTPPIKRKKDSMAASLEDKVAIVTGGGRGIGRSEALALAAAGAKVVVNDLGLRVDGTGQDREPAQAVVSEIRKQGGEAVANFGNVAEIATGAELVEQALDTYGHLDIVVNNAGITRKMRFVDLSEDDWDVQIAMHLKGHFSVARAAAGVFVKQSAGRIINTSSEGGLGVPMVASYAAAKEGITGLTRALAIELAPHNITVNQIRPRSSSTRMFQMGVKVGKQLGAPLSETLPGAREDGLFARPEDFHADRVASFVAFLCSDGASGVTNGDFIVGGGKIIVLSHPQPVSTIDWLADDGPKKLLSAVGC
jgi:3-oxoacyl-[acyl-carrier protein] reductase